MLALDHVAGLGLVVQPPTGERIPVNERVSVSPCAAGVSVSKDGKTLVVANYFNDSITVFSGELGNWSKGTELDLRPGKSDPAKAGIPGGEYPFWVAVKGNGSNATAFVSNLRDREIVVVNLGGKPAVTARIPVKGQPNKMTLNETQALAFAARKTFDLPVGFILQANQFERLVDASIDGFLRLLEEEMRRVMRIWRADIYS